MSARAYVALTGAGSAYLSWWALLRWSAAAYGSGPLPCWVSVLLGLVLVAFFAFIVMFIIYVRRDSRA